jgi:antirestriction protein ArdC
MSKIDVYQDVTNRIIEALEKGLDGKFELPWHGVSQLPENAHTSKKYKGVNVPLLWAYQMSEGYQSGIWATYKQWQEHGAQVRKGEKSAQIVFWKMIEQEPSQDNEDQSMRMFARWSRVFNADQVDGFNPVSDFTPSDIASIGAADALIDATGADIRHGKTKAYYSPSGDFINVPSPERFKDTDDSTATENYYSTLFHELTHWTGAKTRLDRFPCEKFSKSDYAFEGLVAELGAAMACSLTRVEALPRSDHAKYIACWLKALKDDKKFIFSASSHAQKAIDYLQSTLEIERAA